MRVAKALIAGATLTLVAGCASSPPQDVVPKGPRPVAQRGQVIPCRTTDLVVVTTASCGSGGFSFFGAAGE